MKIGEMLQQARTAKGLTLREVENKIQVSNAYLSQLENGKIKSPSFKVIQKLTSLYEIPMGTFFANENAEDKWLDIEVYQAMMTDEERQLLLDYAKYLIFKRTHI